MISNSIKNWTNIDNCYCLLYVAQLIDELLFDYSIPSHRIATLNSHYLCIDACDAIRDIDKYGVPEGALKPIMHELYESLKTDIVLSEMVPKPEHCFIKMNNTEKPYIVSQTKDLCFDDSKAVCSFLRNQFFYDDSYRNRLVRKISELVKANDKGEITDLHKVVASFVTELVNSGYSIRYIYLYNRRFFFGRKRIESPAAIDDYLSNYDFEEKKYSVVFKTNQSIRNFGRFFKCDIQENFIQHTDKVNERNFINSKKKNEAFLIWEMVSFDPYSAAEKTRSIIRDNIAIYRLFDHSTSFNITDAECCIYDEHSNVFFEKDTVSSLERVKKEPDAAINTHISNILNSFTSERNIRDTTIRSLVYSMMNAIRYHSHSIDSISEENRLLDLWAIVETILGISNEHTADRIQLICKYMVPILNHNYIKSLFEELTQDIEIFNEKEFDKIVQGTDEKQEQIKKVCEFCLLADNASVREAFYSKCDKFPLLKERIQFYSSELCTTDKICRFMDMHSQRISWQITRIYRNRNKIIHNAERLPYLEMLVENLHNYVDDVINFMLTALQNGRNLSAVRQMLFANECNWMNNFSREKDNVTDRIINIILRTENI